MQRISTAGTLLTVVLAAGAGPGAGVTLHAQLPAQSPLGPAVPPQSAPPLPHASSDASGAWVGDVLYVHAGEQPSGPRGAASAGKAALYALSPAATSWATVWTGAPVRGAVLSSDGDDLYRVGGVDVSGAPRIRPDLERWDPAGRRWVGRRRGVGLGLASAGGSLYASEMNQLFRLAPDGSAWQTLAYEIEPERASHALVGRPDAHAPVGGPGVHAGADGPDVLHIVGGAAHGRGRISPCRSSTAGASGTSR